jgi:spoIIIJ-associated protein
LSSNNLTAETENKNQKIETDIWLEEFLTGLLDRIGLDVWVSEMEIDDNTQTYIAILDGEDKARIIGKDGQVLDALQHLAISAAANSGIFKTRIILDVDGYRQRKDSHIISDAEHFADLALKTGKVQELEPMNARDRRLIHMIVSKIDGVTTESAGSGADRYVRIMPV